MFEIFCSCDQLAEELQNKPLEEDERELLHLLSTPHIKVHTRRTQTMHRSAHLGGGPILSAYLCVIVANHCVMPYAREAPSSVKQR